MSTNDDPASRRGRRADQGEPDWRAANRSGNQYPGQKPREGQPQNAAYSGFTRQPHPQQQQPYPPPRQEPVLPPLPQQNRPYDAPQVPQGYYQEPAPQAPRAPEPPQGYYQEPAPRYDPPRQYVEQASPYAPPPPPPGYDAGPQHVPYGGTSGELYGRDPSPLGYEQNPYGAGQGYRPEPFDPGLRQPLTPQREDERLYAPRVPQESSAPRYYADEQPQRSAPPSTQQPPLDRGYAQQQQPYSPARYDQPVQHDGYQHGGSDQHFAAGEDWHDGEGHYQGDDLRSGHPLLATQGDDFDEEFPDEDFDSEDYGVPQRGGRKVLFAALLVGAASVVVGGAYGYKTLFGAKGETATPVIHADRTPSKEVPDNPGGKQFPHGEKAIYERLTPDGRTQLASAVPAGATLPQAFTAPAPAPAPGGSSLEERIDEALRRAQSTGDAPGGSAPGAGPGTEQPTVVQSESYRPDGTRVDSRPVITPSIVNVGSGLPYPFGNATAPASQASAAPFKAAPMPSAPQPQSFTATAPAGKAAPVRTASRAPAPAEQLPAAPAGGFYVSLKSAPDEKAIQRDLPALAEKYKSVLGDVQVQAKIADLGAKGVTYRAVAGPVGTKQEAQELCQKIKGVGGDKACFVTN